MSDKSESVRNRDPCSGRETSLQDAAGMRPRQDRYLRTKDVRTGPGLGFAGDLAGSEMRSNSRWDYEASPLIEVTAILVTRYIAT